MNAIEALVLLTKHALHHFWQAPPRIKLAATFAGVAAGGMIACIAISTRDRALVESIPADEARQHSSFVFHFNTCLQDLEQKRLQSGEAMTLKAYAQDQEQCGQKAIGKTRQTIASPIIKEWERSATGLCLASIAATIGSTLLAYGDLRRRAAKIPGPHQ